MKLFQSWCQLEKEDALPLLSLKFAANQIYNSDLTNNKQLTNVYTEIRARAVKSLEEEIKKEGGVKSIQSIILQLVQAYRYESFHQSPLKKFFLKNVFKNLEIANSFHWLVFLDKENADTNEAPILERYKELYEEFMDILAREHSDYYECIQKQRTFR